jgi:L-histidine N-alpha-methyltransferase
MPQHNASALDAFVDLEPKIDNFHEEVLLGLRAPQKRIPSKFFYDDAGAGLFERICTLEEYYVTRTEIEILSAHGRALGALLPAGATVIEFGSGSAEKVRLLGHAVRELRGYVPIDISRAHLLYNAELFAREHPWVQVVAVCADFSDTVDLDGIVPPGPRIGFFPGSTIGNFSPDEAVRFLKAARKMIGSNGFMVIGVDLKKDRQVLEAAYNDSKGVTAAFNLNLLRRINRELGGTFELSNFEHLAFYEPDHSRIEMHLVSRRQQQASVSGVPFSFTADETINTEYSYKYTVEEFQTLAAAAGFGAARTFIDPLDRFSVHCLEAA